MEGIIECKTSFLALHSLLCVSGNVLTYMSDNTNLWRNLAALCLYWQVSNDYWEKKLCPLAWTIKASWYTSKTALIYPSCEKLAKSQPRGPAWPPYFLHCMLVPLIQIQDMDVPILY
jgi:hypothetical protein